MRELIPTINEIVKYGLQPNIAEVEKERTLSRNLVKIYDLSFDIDYVFDETDYREFETEKLPSLRFNVSSNFKGFGFYKMAVNIKDLQRPNNAYGNAIDDLCDIIKDLLEVKWRIENNSVADGLWFFNFIFKAHTEQHILDLLNYIKQLEE